MSAHNIGFHGEIRKISHFLIEKNHLIKSYVYVIESLSLKLNSASSGI